MNPEHLGLIDVQKDAGRDGFIVTNPNCSTIMMVTALAPLRQFKFTDIRVATMQAISGAGFEGVAAMAIYDNVIPYIGKEEEKMETETLKIMGTLKGKKVVNAPYKVSASCHRVPVIDGHTMAVWLDIKEPVDKLKKAFRDYKPPIKGLLGFFSRDRGRVPAWRKPAYPVTVPPGSPGHTLPVLFFPSIPARRRNHGRPLFQGPARTRAIRLPATR